MLHVYVFVVLNEAPEPVQYYVVPGRVLADEPEGFEPRWFQDPKFPGINYRVLEKAGFTDAWHIFDEPNAANPIIELEPPAGEQPKVSNPL